MIPVPMVILRRCKICSVGKPLTAFYKHPQCKFQRTHYCKICIRASMRIENLTPEQRAENNARKKAELDNMSPEKREAIRTKNRERKKNRTPEQRARDNSNERKRHANISPEQRERINARNRIENLTPERHAERNAKAVLKTHKRKGWPVPDGFVKGDLCEYCGTGEAKMEIDHIVPVVLKNWIPAEVKSDVRMFAKACKPCNATKRESLPASERHLSQVSDALGFDVRNMVWCRNLWQPPAILDGDGDRIGSSSS